MSETRPRILPYRAATQYPVRELIAPGVTAETDYRPPYEAIRLAAIASELFGDDELEAYARKESA